MQLLEDIIHGFYSRRFYYDLANERKRLGAGYIIVLTVLSTLFLPVYLWQSYPAMHPVIRQIPALVGTLPAITFQDEKVSIDQPAPFRANLGSGADAMWVIVDPKYVIVDTATLANVLRQSHTVLLLTSDKLMIMKDVQGTLEMEDLKGYPPFSITHEKWKAVGEIIGKRGLTPYMILFIAVIFILMLFYNFLMTLITAVAALILSFILRASFDLSAAVRLAALARIPATIITAAPVLLGVPLSENMIWLVWWGYPIFAVWSCRERVYSRT